MMKTWLKFLMFQSKYERKIVRAVRRYARDLKSRILSQFKFIDFNPNEEADLLWNEIEPELTDALEKLPQTFGLDVDFNLYDARVTARLRQHRRRIKWITDETWRQLRKAIERAMEKGLDIREAVREVLVDLETWRAERIARTESMGAINGGYLDGMLAAGFEKKMWVSALDERTRPTHADANGQVKPISEPFVVGKALLQFPADPSCPYPEEVVNCRCCIVPVESD